MGDDGESLFDISTDEPLGVFRLDGETHKIMPITTGKLVRYKAMAAAAQRAKAEGNGDGEVDLEAAVAAGNELLRMAIPSLQQEQIENLPVEAWGLLVEKVNELLSASQKAKREDLAAHPLPAAS